jgi:hypothetical protein
MSPHDVQIAEIERQLNRLRSHMEQVTREFREAAKGFLRDWYFQQLEEMRQAHWEVVTAMGKDRIHMLKAEAKGLVGQVPERVDQEFSHGKYWTHRKEWLGDPPAQEEMQYLVEQEQPSGAFANGMSKLLGALGSILEKYGFPLGDSGDDVWGRKSLLQQGQYQPAIGWPPSLLNPLKQYHPLCKEYVGAYLRLQKAKQDKEVAMANELWDAS